MNKEEYSLEGLNCPNCAQEIEKAVINMPGVKKAQLNFSLQRLTLWGDQKQGKESLQRLINAIEEGVQVQPYNSEETNPRGILGALGGRIPEILGILLFILLGFGILDMPSSLLPYLVAYLLIGRRVLLRGVKNFLKGKFLDENTLMVIATIGAFTIREYGEAVAVMLFYQLGEFFQDLAVDNSRRSIRKLLDSKPGMVKTLQGEEVLELPAEEVPPHTVYRLLPGERVPLDGIVLKGQGSLDTSALTGESYPRRIEPGGEVLSGFINQEGVLEIESQKTLGESAYSRIINLVEEAAGKKARAEQFITTFARHYTPVVVGLAFLLAFVPPFVLGIGSFEDWLYRALVFLVVSCPCALVISIPLGFFAGIGRASREGILVKGGNYLEAFNKVDSFFFDKTGTLTQGVFKVSSLHPVEGCSEDELLELAVLAEAYSTHPIAQSIRQARPAPGKKEEGRPEDYQELSGRGIRFHLKGKDILAGKASWLAGEGVSPHQSLPEGTAVHIAHGKEYKGALVLSDLIRPETHEALQGLKTQSPKKTRQTILSGDSSQNVALVAKALGVPYYYGDLLPEDKVRLLEEALERGESTAFLGDGINDAPVLARADVGIAMGGLGSDAAIEAADIVLMQDDPRGLVKARILAGWTRKVVTQNIVFSLSTKLIILILATLGIAGMKMAIFGDVGVSLLAILNVHRVLSRRIAADPPQSPVASRVS